MRNLILLMISTFIVAFGSCGKNDETINQEESSQQTENIESSDSTTTQSVGKILVIYYSRSGNTKKVAEAIKNQLDADILEVIPGNDYSDYNKALEMCQTELSAIDKNGTYPPVNTSVENFDNYDFIFVCTPLWWSRMATPMQGFLYNHSNKLANKNIALAVTSHSSGISSVVSDCKRLCNSSSFVGDALWISASNLSNTSSLVEEWISSLNLNTKNVSAFNLKGVQNGSAPIVTLNSGYLNRTIGINS